VFTTTNLLIGLLAALIVGLSKTAVPGGGLLATPLLAMVVSGRLIAGLMLPILIVADLFAMRWFRGERRSDILRPLIVPVAVGFAAGTLFYVVVGSGGRVLDVAIGLIVMAMVALQVNRLVRRTPPADATPLVTNGVGVVGGFTTFVANAAGPVLNTYFTGLGLPKERLIGTSSVFYFTVNLAKVPVYLLLGWLASGGHFFTAESLAFDLAVMPAVLAGVFGGRWMLPRIPQRVFNIAVLVLAFLAAVKLLVGR
jgi:uncharacterized protein